LKNPLLLNKPECLQVDALSVRLALLQKLQEYIGIVGAVAGEMIQFREVIV
jgi:hypothetical protein